MATRLSTTNQKLKAENLSGSNYFQNTMGNSKNFNNSLYDSGELQNNSNIPAQYNFKERSGRLKWKEIMKMDIEAIIRSGDLSPLENYLENLIFASIEECDLEQLPDVYVVKLIKIFQYIMEYLLYTQQRLENDNKSFESKYVMLVNEAYTKEAILKENKILINNLKKDKKEKEMVLHTYKCVIDEYKLGKIPRAENKNLKSSSEKRYFYCEMCQGKKFSSQENLDAHMNRRHTKIREDFSVTKKLPETVEKTPNLDEKFDQMKNFFESYVKNFAQESYLKIFENQKNLENKIYEIKFDKQNEVKEMENQFRTTLMEMKELYLKSSMNMGQIGNSLINPTINKENAAMTSNFKDEENMYEKIKNETQKMSEILAEINRDQNQKIQSLVEQIISVRNTINEELKEIKASSRNESEKKKEKKKDKIKEIKIPKQKENEADIKVVKKEFTPIISHIASIELKMEGEKKIKQDSQRIENKVNIEKPKKKQIFNAGPLESDDEYEIEIKKSRIIAPKKKESIELERKFSFAAESLKAETNRKQSNKNLEFPFNKVEAEITIAEKIDQIDSEKEKEEINLEINKIIEKDINKEDSELEKLEEQYQPAEFSLKNKILENLKSSEEMKELIKLDTIGDVSKEEIILQPASDSDNKNFIHDAKEIPDIKMNNSLENEDVIEQPEIIQEHFQPVNPLIIEKERQIEALKKIEDFYSKMEERDSNSIEKNDANLYAQKIICFSSSTDANKEIQINQKLSQILNINTKKFLDLSQENTIQFDKLNEHSHNNILKIIDNLLKNIENNSQERDYLQEFYARLDGIIGLTEVVEKVKDYKKHKTIMPVPNNDYTKGPLKRHQSAIIMNNLSSREDIDFKNKPQILNKQKTFVMSNQYKSENEKFALEVEDLDDEFDHTK